MERTIPRDEYEQYKRDIEYINDHGDRDEMEALLRHIKNKYGDCSDLHMLDSYNRHWSGLI